MTTKIEMIEIIRAENPNGLRVGDEENGYTDLTVAEYEAQITEWAENRLAKEAKIAEAEALATAKARLAVGNNGESLVADSSTSTGLRYNANFAAGKNVIINGDFGIWQRGTTGTNLAQGVYLADRYTSVLGTGGATVTWSRQAFTAGTAPVAGYEGIFFSRTSATSATGSTFMGLGTRIENVQTFANQTATFSFWAKADTARTATMQIVQNFGSGGSAEVSVTNPTFSITTSWARYSFNVTFPTIAGKTVGTGSYIQPYVYYNAGQITGSATLDTWGWQLEAGSVATAFQTATGTIQGELAACQRYYWRNTGAQYMRVGIGIGATSASAQIVVQNPVPMRVAPTSFDFSTLGIYDQVTLLAATNASNDAPGILMNNLNISVASGVTQYRPYVLYLGSGSGYIGFSAEL